MSKVANSPSNNIEAINVFLIGNNPIELSNIYDKLKDIRNKTFRTEVSFDLKGLFKKIIHFNPACILIDDNVDRAYIDKLLNRLSTHKRTKNIPITVLKNFNRESFLSNAEGFLLKDNMTSELLSSSILNSIKLKKMRRNITLFYKKKKSQLINWA